MLDTQDTIVAVASARGAAPRGVVRLSGPRTAELLAALAGAERFGHNGARLSANVPLRVTLDGHERTLPCDVLLWPDGRSYTGQPSAELHALGSPAVLAALVAACVRCGARIAEPGEFTLRALVAGRIDLVQAEGVLAVIESRSADELGAALAQLAGGLSRPLAEVRAGLLDLLVDLEAGLDFVDEEGVRFVERSEVAARLRSAQGVVARALAQARSRGDVGPRPRVVLAGPPNVGKSSLFNALVERFGIDRRTPRAIVADLPGVTRDPVTAPLRLGSVECELVDTAGVDPTGDASQRLAADVLKGAALVVECRTGEASVASPPHAISILTRCDFFGMAEATALLRTSATTGEGLAELAEAIALRVAGADRADSATNASVVSERCRSGLERADEALGAAIQAHEAGLGEELVSMELRAALDALAAVVGAVTSDEVLGEVFARFCIGK
ncbi:MAG: tRNA modification GTPase [Lacipirellulaceae bacterium]